MIIPGQAKLAIMAASLIAAFGLGVFACRYYYSPRLELATSERDKARARVDEMTDAVAEQNKAISQWQAAAAEAKARGKIETARAASAIAALDSERYRPPVPAATCSDALEDVRGALRRLTK